MDVVAENKPNTGQRAELQIPVLTAGLMISLRLLVGKYH